MGSLGGGAGLRCYDPLPESWMRPSLLLSLALLAGCHRTPAVAVRIDTLPGGIRHVMNLAPSGWRDSSHIRFTEIERIQPPEGSPDELGDIADLAMDPTGQLFIAERGPARIVRYSPEGNRLGVVGREGGGPGEYQTSFLAWTGGVLFVHDPQQQRTSVFDSAGNFLRSWPSACCFWRWIGSDTLGRAYVPVMAIGRDLPHGNGWLRVSASGVVVDTVWRRATPSGQKSWEIRSKVGSSFFSIPGQPGLNDIPWAGGGLLIGDNGDYSITIAPHGTDSALVFGRAWVPQQVPEVSRRAQFDRLVGRNEALKAVAHFEDIPVTAPAFGDMEVDAASRIWVHLNVPSDTVNSYWDLFTPEGVWLGTTKAPFRYGRMAFRPHELAVAMQDQNGLPVVVRYRMEE